MVEAVATTATMFGPTGGYVHAYYPRFDALSHDFGAASDEVVAEFWRIDEAVGQLLEGLAGSGAEVLISADHGFIDSPEAKFVQLEDHPQALMMLDGPLSGERRAAWCEVREGAEGDFAAFAGDVLAGKAVLVRSADLLARGFFGPGPQHRRLRERIGTHALLMEPGWTLWDRMPGERLHRMIGVHGGLAPEEMWVPLVRMTC